MPEPATSEIESFWDRFWVSGFRIATQLEILFDVETAGAEGSATHSESPDSPTSMLCAIPLWAKRLTSRG